MKLALLAPLLLVALAAAPLAQAQHVNDVIMTGLGVDGAGALYKARVQTFSNYRYTQVDLTPLVGGTAVSSFFTSQLVQTGLDNDPIPELFRRTISDTSASVDFQLDGAMAQWEQTPNQWDHAYVGHYGGVQLALVVIKLGETFVQLP
ncbi:MAG TPA: hypothetical protein VGR28_06600 [Candidatus Thermoplasmatota archaeon]|jgi:hypothetical protein|nr:hypothetical protein [Candidatus Thermoplasmatota archaeon]